ncbi:DUF6011 domain-containing protein [Nocardia farcinica]|uniref:DUF6011 domain-containing protein n=1 Tax=Nocardia farcinica TaxID=37329 RepID=UPI0024B5A306|nr:DUF6011 domain-containing protein [Nocardia farcinica]
MGSSWPKSRGKRCCAGSTGARPEVRLVAHCRSCNGWLVSAESVRAGIGPQCAAREVAEQRTGLRSVLHSVRVCRALGVA